MLTGSRIDECEAATLEAALRKDRMRSGAGEIIPLATVEHGGCGDDRSQPVAVAPNISVNEPSP